MRYLRRLTVLVLLVTVVAATPTPAAAATPAITVDEVEFVGGNDIAVSGTLTCSQPTGQAALRYSATNTFPLEVAQGFGETTVPCGAGPVPWVATASSGIFGFDDAWPLSVIAYFLRDGVSEAATLQYFPPGWGG